MQTSVGGAISCLDMWRSLPVAPKLLTCCAAIESLLWIANFAANAATASRRTPPELIPAAAAAACTRARCTWCCSAGVPSPHHSSR